MFHLHLSPPRSPCFFPSRFEPSFLWAPTTHFPVFPHRNVTGAGISIDEHRFNELRAVMLRLPTINRSIMQLLALFLSRVSDHQRVNNMTVKVIASVIGPYILAPAEENPSTIVKTTAAILSVTGVSSRKAVLGGGLSLEFV